MALTASKVALELLAWDKARTLSQIPRDQRQEADELIDRGAAVYQALLASIHGEDVGDPDVEGEEWLAESRAVHVPTMMQKGGLFSPPKLRLSEADTELLDRTHPELTFSGGDEQEAEFVERAAEDPLEQLRGLRELHDAGALTDAEFAEAKARVIGQL